MVFLTELYKSLDLVCCLFSLYHVTAICVLGSFNLLIADAVIFGNMSGINKSNIKLLFNLCYIICVLDANVESVSTFSKTYSCVLSLPRVTKVVVNRLLVWKHG